MLILRTWAKRKKAYTGKKDPPKKKKNPTITIKDFTKNCYIFPIPFARSQQEVIVLCVHDKHQIRES